MKPFSLSFLFFILALNLYAQGKEDYTWLMGSGSGGTKIDFNIDSAEISFYNLPYHFSFIVPCSISDSTGKLEMLRYNRLRVKVCIFA